MRYYVVVETETGHGIVGEVLRESFDDGRFRDSSMAANLAGPNGVILTRAEIVATNGGPEMLHHWEAGVDSLAQHWLGDGPGMWLVRSDDEEHFPRSLYWEAIRTRAESAREQATRLKADLQRLEIQTRSLNGNGERHTG